MASDSQRTEARKWLEAWYAVGDSCVPSNSIKWFASDCTVQFNNEAPDHGKEAVQKTFEFIIPMVASMKHRIIDFDVIGDRIYNECEVTYVAAGDPEQIESKMHRINVYDRVPSDQPESGQIKRWMAFFDSGPFQERMKVAMKAKGEVGGARIY